MKKISELLVSIALFLFGIVPSAAFFIWIERNMALPWVGTWVAWPWIFIEGGLPAAILFNLGLVAAFGALHSGLAGRIPRPFYTLISGIAATLLMGGWQPTGIIVYQLIPTAIPSSILSMLIYWSLLAIGFRAIARVEPPARFLGFVDSKDAPPMRLWTGGLYRYCRHPLYTLTLAAWILTPMMSLDRVVFIVGMSVYLAFGIRNEERRLVAQFGDEYREYQRTTPMLLPKKPRHHDLDLD